MPDSAPIIVSIRRTLRLLVAATVVLYLAIGGLGVYVYIVATNNGDALCALRTDLEKRVEDQTNFLVEHPNGIPGISVKVIQSGIDNQQRTIEALSGLSCD